MAKECWQSRHHTRIPSPCLNLALHRRWLAWGIYLGRARSSARGAVARNRWHFRHVGGGDECRGACRWSCQRRGQQVPGQLWKSFLAPHLRRRLNFSRFARRGPLDVILGRWTLDSSPIYVAMDLLSRLVSPYDLNPMGKNPLRAILAETINFERLARAPIKLFITCLKTSSLSLVSAAHLSIALVTRRALQEAHRKSGQGGPREAGSNGCLISIGVPRSNINSSI